MITNAGGVNPQGCADAIARVAKQAGVNDLKLAVVRGDNLMAHVSLFINFTCKELYQNGGSL